MSEPKIKINRRVLGYLGRAIIMFVRSPVGVKGRWLAAALMTLMICINALNVLNSFVARNFMSAIERRENDGFVYFAWLYAGVFCLSTVAAVYFRFTEERLGLLWREWLTRHIVERYIDSRIYLQLEGSSSITNPDQRIADDVRSLTVTTLSFVLMLINSTITALSFAGVLWAISPKLFLVSVVYAIAGSFLTILLGRRLIGLNYRQADYEADFRAHLIKLRDGANDISSPEQEREIREGLLTRIDSIASNMREIFKVNRNLGFFTTGYNYMIQLIPILIVAPIFIASGEDFGIIGQSSMAFATLVGALSLIVTQFQSISSYTAVITRLGELVEAAENIDERRSKERA